GAPGAVIHKVIHRPKEPINSGPRSKKVLGEHTEAVLREAGYTPEEVARLVEKGVVRIQAKERW
ncbi:hypothetical protein, partial [Thermus scotoductus]|uniref:hypothetical protein n=1 Tax=Thermus scotoductus TaxID=37636 RepID=UPI001C12A6B7